MAQTTINTGNIVVPFSTIIDQLKGKLEDSQIEALLYYIASKRITEVKPGDLITAELINQILSELADLNVRVAKLEAAGTGSESPVTEKASGNIHVTWNATSSGNPRGTDVVPEDTTPYPYEFFIINSTDKNMQIALTVKLTGATGGDWSQSASFSNNKSTSLITVSARGGLEKVTVNVTVPKDAVIDDKLTLTVDAKAVPPYTQVSDPVDVELKVSKKSGPPVEGKITLLDFTPQSDKKLSIKKGTTIYFEFNVKYEGVDPGENSPCELIITVAAGLSKSTWEQIQMWEISPDGLSTKTTDDQLNRVRTYYTYDPPIKLSFGSLLPLAVKLIAPDEITEVEVTFTVRLLAKPETKGSQNFQIVTV